MVKSVTQWILVSIMTATSTRLAQLTQFTATNVNAIQDMKAMEKHVFIKVKNYK